MFKLAIGVAGIALSALGAILFFQSQGRGFSSTTTTSIVSPSYQGNSAAPSSNPVTFINDVKEIFGLPPISRNSLLAGKSGGSGGGGGGDTGESGGSEGVGYLPPKSFQEDVAASGKSQVEEEMTTPFFRIIIPPPKNRTQSPAPLATSPLSPETPLPTKAPTTPMPMPSERKEETVSESTTLALNMSEVGSQENVTEIEETFMTTIEMRISENEVQTPVTTLEPPPMTETSGPGATDSTINMEHSLGKSGLGLSNGLYLPPNKEYLPPPSRS